MQPSALRRKGISPIEKKRKKDPGQPQDRFQRVLVTACSVHPGGECDRTVLESIKIGA